MTTRYDICTGRKDNTGKTRWTKIGAMFPAREGDGFTIKLDALPIPNEKGEVWISAFVPRERDDQGHKPASAGRGYAAKDDPLDDDIPF